MSCGTYSNKTSCSIGPVTPERFIEGAQQEPLAAAILILLMIFFGVYLYKIYQIESQESEEK